MRDEMRELLILDEILPQGDGSRECHVVFTTPRSLRYVAKLGRHSERERWTLKFAEWPRGEAINMLTLERAALNVMAASTPKTQAAESAFSAIGYYVDENGERQETPLVKWARSRADADGVVLLDEVDFA